jgi:PucR-like helix-turn-helix protein/diguanylate cyclase with GGDEF domain
VRAGWRPPAQIAALVVEGIDSERLASRLGLGAVAAPLERPDGVTGNGSAQRVLAFVPDPGARPPSDATSPHGQLAQAVAGLPAALGPTVTLAGCPRSAERARRALDLAALGILRGDELIVVEEHTADLVLHADPALASELAEDRLAPLGELRPGVRARLTESLRAWLDCQGRVDETARALSVHPQTVRYRLNQLREVFEGTLDDPQGRFELALALRVRGEP